MLFSVQPDIVFSSLFKKGSIMYLVSCCYIRGVILSYTFMCTCIFIVLYDLDNKFLLVLSLVSFSPKH